MQLDFHGLATVSVHVVNSAEELDKQLDYFLSKSSENQNEAIGFDAEWRSSQFNRKNMSNFRRGFVSVLQLATAEKVLIIQLLQTGITLKLRKFLQCKEILKVGAGLSQDSKNLFEDYQISLNGIVELNDYFGTKKKMISLSKMTEIELQVELEKSLDITLSDWETPVLSKEQIHYAAFDAIAVFLVYQSLSKTSFKKINSFFKFDHENVQEKNKTNAIISSETLPQQHLEKVLEKQRQKKQRVMNASRQNNLYDNCQLLAPDGVVISMVPEKKMKWYIRKQLAIPVGPKCIKLLFEPNARTNDQDDFYLGTKVNECVSCARSEFLNKFYIVPYEFRKAFPLKFRARSSHDIVLLCVDCREKISPNYLFFRSQIVHETLNLLGFGNKSEHEYCETQFVKDHEALKAQKVIKSLQKFGDKMPLQRKDDLIAQLKDINIDFHNVPLRDKILAESAVTKDPKFIPVASLVIQSLLEGKLSNYFESTNVPSQDLDEHALITAFVRKYRALFLDVLQPKSMPIGWRLEHKIQDYNSDGD